MAEVPASGAGASMNAPGGQQNHGRGGRNRGGRHRNRAQNRERSQRPNPGDADGAQGSNPPAADAPTAQEDQGGNSQNGGRGRGGRGGRRGPRNPRRGGGSGRGGGAQSNHRTVAGGQRTFGGHLTAETGPETEAEPSQMAGLSGDAPEFVPGQPVAPKRENKPGPKSIQKAPAVRKEKSNAPDLPTRIHEDISNGQYECVICTSEVFRNSRVWSCSICWTVAHLSCVRKWHTNQTKKPAPPGAQPTYSWRCPGCNSSLTEEPTTYHCWCSKELSPKSIPGLPPHSCSQTCGKPRETCPHPCPLVCHAGPCPPCEMMGPAMPCFCGKNTSTKRCGETDYANGWTCGQICGDLLPCGEHDCRKSCHSEIPCEQRGDQVASFDHGQLHTNHPDLAPETEGLDGSWFWGSFKCEGLCGRKFDCGDHTCNRPCHTQGEATAHCPFSPDVVTNCPCGKTPLMEILEQPRTSCKDPIPSCDRTCNKLLPCGHHCSSGCHSSACPPCTQETDITCRCGRITTSTICHQGVPALPECFRVCRAQLNCGRHSHDQHCCPGEKKAIERTAAKRKRKNLGSSNEEVEAEHICTRICGRPLKCGRHNCSQLCHSGFCATCPEAIFEEISCHCGRTVLQPPQPCGTRPPVCRFECDRPDRPCGHPRVSHNCHPDDKPCPPCPFLVEKRCICGKQTLKNQPCWFEEPRCGLPCNKKLKCGAHHCTKSCHRPGQCEDAGIKGSHCNQPCLKVRKSCDHVDLEPCHAPFPCKEDKPCQAKTFVTCECQHKKQEVKCLASKSNPWPERTPLKCDDECLRLQRNARLAAALNIDPETHKDDHVPYSDKTLQFFKDNAAWTQRYEAEFRVFASTPKEKRLRFKPMKSQQRAFLHSLAEDYGLDSESQDPEPHRHVTIFKTPKFVSAPAKTLAQCAKIRASNNTQSAPRTQQSQTINVTENLPFNALVLTAPRFGLTIEELQSSLTKNFASQPTLTFTISFLPANEVVIRGSGGWTPQTLESAMKSLKPAVQQTIVARQDMAKAVFLCRVDTSLNVVRREVDTSKTSDGWNSIVSRSAARQQANNKKTAAAAGMSNPDSVVLRSKFVGLKKEKKKVQEPVEDDWLAAAEKLDDE